MGEFSFNDLPQSNYTVKVEASGFQATEATGVQVQAGKVYTLPLTLSVAKLATTVEVAADALSLDTTTTTQITVLDGQALKTRRQAATTASGSFQLQRLQDPGSVNGTRSNQINYTIDGTDNNDLYLNVNAVSGQHHRDPGSLADDG